MTLRISEEVEDSGLQHGDTAIMSDEEKQLEVSITKSWTLSFL